MNTDINNRQQWIYRRAEGLIKKNRTHVRPHPITVLGQELIIMPEVFSPVYGEGSRMLGDCLQKWSRSEESILEIGTGSGLLAILAARKSNKVIATDVCYNACSCALSNVVNHELSDKITVKQGDLFAPIDGASKFSLIVFNPPFMGTDIALDQDTDLLRAMYDPGYQTLNRFFQQVSAYLNDQGRILLAFSNCGDAALLEVLIEKHGFVTKRISDIDGALEFYVYEIKRENDQSEWLAKYEPILALSQEDSGN